MSLLEAGETKTSNEIWEKYINTIVEGDFLEKVKEFPDNTFDVRIADP